jgi:hypothetical protein
MSPQTGVAVSNETLKCIEGPGNNLYIVDTLAVRCQKSSQLMTPNDA